MPAACSIDVEAYAEKEGIDATAGPIWFEGFAQSLMLFVVRVEWAGRRNGSRWFAAGLPGGGCLRLPIPCALPPLPLQLSWVVSFSLVGAA